MISQILDLSKRARVACRQYGVKAYIGDILFDLRLIVQIQQRRDQELRTNLIFQQPAGGATEQTMQGEEQEEEKTQQLVCILSAWSELLFAFGHFRAGRGIAR